MPETLDCDALVKTLRGAAASVKAEHRTLSRLDSFGGDGDHGTTMLRAVKTLEETLDAASSKKPQDLLKDVGWAIMGIDGGATGPLLGMLFTGMAEAAENRETLDAADLADLFESGLAAVQKQTEARVGDKTLMDALVPAVQALRRGAQEGDDVVQALRRAAAAAQAGAAATKDLQAKFGRAKNVGERSIGQPDPGATSISLIFRGFVQGAEKYAR